MVCLPMYTPQGFREGINWQVAYGMPAWEPALTHYRYVQREDAKTISYHAACLKTQERRRN